MTLTKSTKNGYHLGDSYLELLKRFPLMPIRDESAYDRATAILQDLFGRKGLNADQNGYIDSLAILVDAYEAKKYDFDKLPVDPLDLLKHLMEANGMSSGDLGEVIGSQSYASMILRGTRSISKENAKKLGERFYVDAGLFL